MVGPVYAEETAAVPPAPEAAPAEAAQAPARETGEMGSTEKVDPRELLEQVMMARLSKDLALDEEQTVLMVRQFMDFRDEQRALRKTRNDLFRELEQALRGSKGDTEIAPKLEALIAQDKKIEASRDSLFENASAGLTAWQKGRLYIFLSRFENDMRHMVQRARERFRPSGGEGRQGAWGEEGGPMRPNGDGPEGGPRKKWGGDGPGQNPADKHVPFPKPGGAS
ncbi:MAG: hypothetical protein HYV26_16195 [Candidatus Hydrogenedentes bacterium]|nr:hypothetical protein [Candidatus Hydrogenedentota bacterium]MBI3117700.1 hypothetical protein [Candidatus Hydrogenedentota bacterium]